MYGWSTFNRYSSLFFCLTIIHLLFPCLFVYRIKIHWIYPCLFVFLTKIHRISPCLFVCVTNIHFLFPCLFICLTNIHRYVLLCLFVCLNNILLIFLWLFICRINIHLIYHCLLNFPIAIFLQIWTRFDLSPSPALSWLGPQDMVSGLVEEVFQCTAANNARDRGRSRGWITR